MAEFINPPQEPGWYLAATANSTVLNAVVEVIGEVPFMRIGHVHLFTQVVKEWQIVRFGNKLELEFPVGKMDAGNGFKSPPTIELIDQPELEGFGVASSRMVGVPTPADTEVGHA